MMLAFVERAGEHEFAGRYGLALPRTLGAIEGKKNGLLALAASNAEIPAHIGLGPLRDIHKNPDFRV